MDEELLRVAYIQMKIANEALDNSARCLQEIVTGMNRAEEEANGQPAPLVPGRAGARTPSAEPAP